MISLNKKFMLIMVAFFIAAFIEGNILLWSVFYGFFLSFIIGLLYVSVKSCRINFKIEIEDTLCYTNEVSNISTKIENDSVIFIPYIEIRNKTMSQIDEKYNGYMFSLSANEVKLISNEVNFNVRGVYDLGQIDFIIKDLFLIVELKKNIKIEKPIKVYPKVYQIREIKSNGSDVFKNIINVKGNIEETSSISNIRKYKMGDSLRKIHWKASAKYGELYMKSFDMVSSEKSNLFLNMNIDDFFMEKGQIFEESLIEFYVSVVNYMLNRGVYNNLYINNLKEKYFHVKSEEDFYEVMEYFVTAKSKGTMNLGKFIQINLDKIDKNSSIGVFTCKMDSEIRNILCYIKEFGYKVALFYISADGETLNNVNILRQQGVNCLSFKEMVGNN